MGKTLRMMDKDNQLIALTNSKPFYADIRCVRMRDGVMFGKLRESGLDVFSKDKTIWREHRAYANQR